MKPIRILALLEATSITGPAKNLLQFAQLGRAPEFDPAVDVQVAVFHRGGSNLFLDAAKRAGVTTHVIPEAGRFDRAVVDRIVALIGELKPDILQTHAVKSHFLVRMGKLDRLAPWIAFHHGYTWPDMRARVYNQLDRWSLRTPRRIVTVSRPFADEIAGKGAPRDRIEIVHNAINPAWGAAGREPQARAALREKLGIDPASKVILLVGRLSREKDHQTLLQAVSDLVARQIDAHLLLVGDGPERPAIQAAIRQLRLEGRVTLTGQVPSAEPYYGAADICVLSSLSEGSPNALLEGMAARVPVVATAVGGVPEIATDQQNALLVPARNRARMAEALAALATDQALAARLADAAYQRILTAYTPGLRVRRLIEIYRSVLQETVSVPR